MKASRLIACLSLILVTLFSLSCQSHPGANTFEQGQKSSNSVPSLPDSEITISSVSATDVEVASPGRGDGVSSAISAETAILNQALGLVGLPGLNEDIDHETIYDQARSMHKSYADRNHRNPDGSYGQQSSSFFEPGNISESLLQRAVSAGSEVFSSWAEGWLGGYGKARLNLRLNLEGHVSGSGDFLLPIYDSVASTLFTQLGLRTMSGDRVIGNFGLGQRFFFKDDWALGYNGFLDYDFSRSHVRGGLGLEAWYDWLRLATNYYVPLSGWKDSNDYNSFFVEERPAEGWDTRLTGYLPFYRNLAVRGAFEQWKGGHVGSFGRNDYLNNDPKVWSAGLEWTPIPILSVSADKRFSGGHRETQVGLVFNYYFGMPWAEQLSADTVAELRTVEGSRHEFVDRQYEMILEYREKEGIYNIIPLGMNGQNVFVFQVTTGLGLAAIGQKVKVTTDQGVTFSQGEYTTNQNGRIAIVVITVPTTVTPPVMATLNVGRTTRTFPLATNATAVSPHLRFTPANGPDFTDPGPQGYQSTASLKVEFVDDSGNIQTISAPVTWVVKSIQNPTAAWWKRGTGALNGLTWGDLADGESCWGVSTVHGASCSGPFGDIHGVEGILPISADIELTDVVGQRSVILEASVVIDGITYTGEETVSFGVGPLSVFTSAPVSGQQWATQDGNSSVSGSGVTDNDFTSTGPSGNNLSSTANTFPAAATTCGGTVNNSAISVGGSSGVWTATFPDSIADGWLASLASEPTHRYSTTSHLPTMAQLVAVSRYDVSYNNTVHRKGAALAAGWQDDGYGLGDYEYWTGQVRFLESDLTYGVFNAVSERLSYGGEGWYYPVTYSSPVLVCTGS